MAIGLGKGDKLLPKSLIATNNTKDEIMIRKKPKKLEIELAGNIFIFEKIPKFTKCKIITKNCKKTRIIELKSLKNLDN